MLSRLATALSNAVDALAPPLPLSEEFVWHWQCVMRFYTDRHSSSQKPIELTGLPGRLEEMSKLLEQEEAELGSDSLGPCLEQLLQRRMLDQMSALARADAPPGIKRCVLQFVSRLLASSGQALLPQMAVSTAVHKLVGLCGEVLAAPTERDEVHFLNVVCQKIRTDPGLLNCFLSSPGDPQGGAEGPSSLLKALLTLMECADSDVSTLAAECLILCMANVADDVARYVVGRSDVCTCVVRHLMRLYTAVPRSLHAADIDEAVAFWSSDAAGDAEAQPVLAPGKRRLLCFFKWLGFVDTLVELSHAIIGARLGQTFAEDFLCGVLRRDFADAQTEEAFLFEITLVTTCLRNVTSAPLVAAFGAFLLGDAERPSLKDALIERGRDPEASPQLLLATLQVFEELLQRPSRDILDSLVLGHLVGRGYHGAAGEVPELSDDDGGGGDPNDFDVSPGSSPVSRTFAPARIHRILNCFLLLLPDEIKSCEDTGYDAYIADAHRQYQEALAVSEAWDWPSEPLCEEHTSAEDDQSSDSQPEADHRGFQEGPFLAFVLDTIEKMHRQPYDVNLLVTSLVSRLALFAHPNLHEYLLNPLLPLAPGARSLFTSLLKVVEEIQVAVRGTDSLRRKLVLTRSALLGDGGDDAALGEESSVLEALIVIEEFCKELAAVAFVKYHAAS
ncbi:FHF complex subunit HOOK interacting protein 2A [Ixodes scapularis]|uniref:FHF complex subunit HOOK interacting protein 2A n=1 Tax=Ixodes scapularis TaxID=6945 RepID=UPI001A9EE9F0|nr:FHF complex subunit HOOK interacting protein 2A [Ixodes scapularis]